MRKTIDAILRAFLGVLTQPFQTDLREASTAAATAISLYLVVAGLDSSGVLDTDMRGSASLAALALVLVWMAGTAIFSRSGHARLAMARNLSVVAFWMAVTLVLGLVGQLVVSSGERTPLPVVVAISVSLVFLILVHMCRNLALRSALWMSMGLWLTTISLTSAIFYGGAR